MGSKGRRCCGSTVHRQALRYRCLTFSSPSQLCCASASWTANFAMKPRELFSELLNQLRKKKWIVYAKPPFGGPAHVLRYLGRYTHRIAISNHRLLAFDGKRVSFRWKDYA